MCGTKALREAMKFICHFGPPWKTLSKPLISVGGIFTREKGLQFSAIFSSRSQCVKENQVDNDLYRYRNTGLCYRDTVETLYSTIYYSKYFIELNVDKSTEYVALWTHKDTPYLALSGELWSVFYEYFNRNWPCYKGFLLYNFQIKISWHELHFHYSVHLVYLYSVFQCPNGTPSPQLPPEEMEYLTCGCINIVLHCCAPFY